MKAEYQRALSNGLRAMLALLDGNPITAARYLVAGVLDLVTQPAAEQLLSDEAVRRANEAADIFEQAKFPGKPEP